MSSPSAKVIADSITDSGHRLTTLEVVMHRFVLAEANTHRVFSRNSASSRAIPLHKQLERVKTDLAWPVKFPLEQPGMQGADAEVNDLAVARQVWENAAWDAMQHAEVLGKLGVHKSVANRLLEPFMWHTVVITSTAWENFLTQRVSPLAQPEIREAAQAVQEARETSVPNALDHTQWHLPYIQQDEHPLYGGSMPWHVAIPVSVARVARTSYLTQAGVRDYEEDVRLYDRLVDAEPMHASPLEHIACPAEANQHLETIVSRVTGATMSLELPRYGNFLGWHQHRFDVEATKHYQAFA